MTNYEKIKNMTIEEMAEIFCVIDFDVNKKCSENDCTTCAKEWLKAEAKEDENADTQKDNI